MNPAYSVIFFTVSSGAGYGLLALLGLVGFNHGQASSSAFAVASLVLALILITLGLLSSLLHLGHPERAWRALSQWRSSWLSREGVMAVMTYPIALVFGAVWSGLADAPSLIAPFGLILFAMSAVTVFCTAMIYRSLRTIRQWNHKLVVPCYLGYALATGACLLLWPALAFGRYQIFQTVLSLAALAAVMITKLVYWWSIDRIPRTHTMGEATGLGTDVRQWEVPHTNINFIQKEMGFVVARKHAKILRLIVLALILFAILAGLGALVATPWLTLVMAPAVITSAFVERWLFFAEAEHAVNLYYGKPSV